MKKVFLIILSLSILLLFSGCCLSHEWVEASCTAPKTCSKCEKTEGEPLGHQWKEATCAEAKHCTLCGLTEGENLEHTFGKEEILDPNYVEATATFVKTCTKCGEKIEQEGNLEHLADGKVFLMTPEEFSDRFTNMLMDMQHLVGNDQYLSFIDDGSTSRTLKMYMCRRVNGNITIPGEFGMFDSNGDPLMPEQYAEAGSFHSVRGTVKGDKQVYLAMLALWKTVFPNLTDKGAQRCVISLETVSTPSERYSFLPFEDCLFEIVQKGGSTYELSLTVR